MKYENYQLEYRGDIEGLRALAILMVIGAHAGVPWLTGGFVGVDVFFVLSGFLITGLLLREVAETGSIAFGRFYLRRLRRLMPALVLMVLVTSLVAAFVLTPAEQLQQPSAAAMATLWISNIHFAVAKLDYFAPGTDTNLFLHTWSLGVEEQFYLVWPLFLLGVAGRRLTYIRRCRTTMTCLIVAGLLASCVLTPRLPQWAFYMMPIRAWEFAVGALIWVGIRGRPQSPLGSRVNVGLAQWTGWIGLVMVIVPAFVYGPATPYPGWRAVFPVLGTAIMVWAGTHGRDIGVSRLLSVRPMQWLGRISYSWYLWHWPILLLAVALADSHDPWVRGGAIAVALVVALASYRWVEYPMRHQSWWLTRERVAWMGSLTLMMLVYLLSNQWFAVASAHLEDPAALRYTRARSDMPVIYAQGCDEYFRSSELHPCISGKPGALHTVVLMGDSIAGQWFPAVSKVFGGPDWRVVVLTKSACPMVDEPFVLGRIRRLYKECDVWRQRALTHIAAMHPDVVILSTVATNDFSEAQWTDGTSRVLERIAASTSRIFILRGTPRLPFDGPECLVSHGDQLPQPGIPRACQAPAADPHDELVKQWLREASSRYANVAFIDMNDLVCPGGTCSAEMGGAVVFRDAQHMTASFTLSLAPELERRIGLKAVDGAAHHSDGMRRAIGSNISAETPPE
jgi:peptidoglycan/LPS O-acetylase OafA/YrhL